MRAPRRLCAAHPVDALDPGKPRRLEYGRVMTLGRTRHTQLANPRNPGWNRQHQERGRKRRVARDHQRDAPDRQQVLAEQLVPIFQTPGVGDVCRVKAPDAFGRDGQRVTHRGFQLRPRPLDLFGAGEQRLGRQTVAVVALDRVKNCIIASLPHVLENLRNRTIDVGSFQLPARLEH